MKITREWFKAFNISEEQAESWLNEAKSGENFTFWCLENKKIDTNKYLQWAKDHYKLPVINSHFFEKLSDTPWWSIVSSVSNWSERFLPIVEWDNTIFIACVEPKEGTHWSFPVQFLLTDPENLKKWWEHLNSNLPTISQPHIAQAHTLNSVAVPPQSQGPEAPTSRAQTNLNMDEPTSSVSLTKTRTQPPTAEPEVIQEFEAPEGFNLAPQGFTPESTIEASVGFEMPQGFEAPEGFNLDPQSFNPESTVEAPVGFEMPQGFEAPEGFNLDPQTFNPESTVEAPVGFEIPQNIKPNQQQTPPQQVVVVIAPPQPLPAQRTSQNSQPQSGVNSQAAQPDELASSEFTNLVSDAYTNYDAIMILMFEGENLRPWVHDGKWTSKNSTALETFKIQQPCIFKIVKNSAQPFHGPVSQNEINESFFQKWNYPQIPGFVTLTPIKYDSYIAGMVLAVGSDEKCNSLLALEKMERITETIKPFIESHNRAA